LQMPLVILQMPTQIATGVCVRQLMLENHGVYRTRESNTQTTTSARRNYSVYKHIFQHPPLIEACRCQSRDQCEFPFLFMPSSVASYHPPSIEVCSNHIYHSNFEGLLKRKDTTELRGSLIIAYRKTGRLLFFSEGQFLLYCLCIHILV
jgi:hypothetical protein